MFDIIFTKTRVEEMNGIDILSICNNDEDCDFVQLCVVGFRNDGAFRIVDNKEAVLDMLFFLEHAIVVIRIV